MRAPHQGDAVAGAETPAVTVGLPSRFRQLSTELRHEAAASGRPELAAEIDEFLARFRAEPQRLPRSARERLEAQQLLRRLLTARRCYGVVYAWYEAFKAPYSADERADVELQARQLADAAAGFGFLRGHDTVLECGCGAQSLGLLLARHNRRWIASDVYRPEALAALEARFSPVGPFEFRLVDGVTLDGIPDRSVDAVVSRSFLEHLLLDDAARHLENAARVLRPGGVFVCLCPAGIGPPSDVTQEFPEYDTPQGLHIKEYRIAELAAALQRAGFSSVGSHLLRTRYLPPALEAWNLIGPGPAGWIERLAQWSWPLARRTVAGRRAWRTMWAHVGATPLKVTAVRGAAGV